jgi:hypothetical protein
MQIAVLSLSAQRGGRKLGLREDDSGVWSCGKRCQGLLFLKTQHSPVVKARMSGIKGDGVY